MKITSLQENLKSGLFFVSHIAGKNVNLPILNNVMIEASGGNIKFITTDLEIGIIASVRGKVDKEGVFTVDSKILNDFVSLLPNQKVEIEQDDLKLKIKSGENYKTTVKGQIADDFPLIPQIEKESYYKIDIDDLKKALSQVIFAVSTSETRIELSGVYFDLSGSELILASTDSYRLAEKKVKVKSNGSTNSESKKMIVPAKTVQELIRILSAVKNEDVGEKKTEVEIYTSENQILFVVGKIELISRLIEGQYPDYTQIIPTNFNTESVVSKSELSRAVKAAAIFSKSGVNDVNLDFLSGQNKITVSSESSQVGDNFTELTARTKGKDNGMVVNYRYLLDGINNINAEDINLRIVDNATPCILCPEKDDSYLYIIMPIKQ